ncbi:hypothetical protein A3D88_02800 [Candidatus Peribacteria bacterium RIFCSPHIGHO2_02_FULL_52_16]|nr:MAG: hypothetical protein A2706_00625 [Candidatus Peribacteria bacterium RIFCSPHIGHO2_01_FULL_51_35]OGJ61688.1 MAG: hypothetical protein A3D88_02800 [Candidatus Peribacteria bacterium RIFCSPHIGHO2_02_FULL_52_16]
MSLLPTTLEHLRTLLARARQENMRNEVTERLEWFFDFATHRSISRTCRTFGIARSTFYRWLKRFDPADLRSLEDKPTPLPEKFQTWTMQMHSVPEARRSRTTVPEVAVSEKAEVIEKKEESVPVSKETAPARFAWGAFAMGLLIGSVVINLLLLLVLLGAPKTDALRASLLGTPEEPCTESSPCPPQP